MLGRGGFGITYRAHDPNLNKVVAIKEYLPGEFAMRTARSTVVPNSAADAADYKWGQRDLWIWGQRAVSEAHSVGGEL